MFNGQSPIISVKTIPGPGSELGAGGEGVGRRFFFCCFTRFLPFYPTTEPDPRLIKRCFKSGVTGGGGGGVNGHQRYTQDYERRIILCYSVGD